MRPTRRGWAVIAAVVVAFASAAAFGPRGLNAVVAPGIVALLAAVWQLYRFEPPTVSRTLPARGERGSTVRVRLSLETATPRSAHVVESLDPGLEASGADRTLSVGDTTTQYDLHLAARGERRVGPVRVVARDVLGLLSRTVNYSDRETIVVRPRVHLLSGPRREALTRLHGGASDDRQAFDGLRRYRRGDPLRDIHWKSSARQPDGELVVRQFATEEGARTVEIAVESAPGSADAMAEAAASVAVALLEAGVQVGLTTPSGRVDPDDGGGREAILDHLAVAGHGTVPPATRTDADVHVSATASRLRVTIGGVEHPFSALAGSRLVVPDGADARAAVSFAEAPP